MLEALQFCCVYLASLNNLFPLLPGEKKKQKEKLHK